MRSLEDRYNSLADRSADLKVEIAKLRALVRDIIAVMDNEERTPEEMLLMERAKNTITSST